MKILFLLDNLKEYAGANIGIAIQIAKQLKIRGNDISVLCWNSIDVDNAKKNIFDNVLMLDRKEIRYRVSGTFVKSGFLKKLLKSFCSPQIYVAWFLSKLNLIKMKKRVQSLVNTEQVDVIIAVINPFYMAKLLARVETSAKKIVIEFDTYTNNGTLDINSREKRRKEEEQVISKLDYVFAMSSHYGELIRDIPSQAFRIIEMELPIIYDRQIDLTKRQSEGKIRFVFTGMLYEDIRNPKYLFELFKSLPNNYEICIAGCGCENLIREYEKILGNKLKYFGLMSSIKAEELLYTGTILVNLNNSISNQLPSKLFECINTGYPMLNICKLQNCPSLKYVEKYSNCLTIFESTSPEINAQSVVEFVRRNKGVLAYEEIQKLFNNNTVSFAANQILETIKS